MPQEERNSTLAEAPTFFQLYSEVTPEILSFLAQESPFTDLDENLVGMGIGYKTIRGNSTNHLCLKFYVSEKLSSDTVRSEKLVPPKIKLGRLGEFLTDVEAIGSIELESLKFRMRPVLGGYSIGHQAGGCGSIACLVRKRGEPDKKFILSASHVIAASGTGTKGDKVLQPGTIDYENVDGFLAKLYEWVPFDFSPLFSAHVDAAIAGPVTDEDCSTLIAEIDSPPSGTRDFSSLSIGMQIQKVGRTTRRTTGKVRDREFRTSISYKDPRTESVIGNVNYENLILCTNYSKQGDSGALVLDNNKHAVGLHIGGTTGVAGIPRTKRSFFLPIEFVLNALDVELVTETI